jgi:putative thiamine transport system substrate-binding protein
MMADGEIDLAISFDPGEASAAIAAAELPPSVRTFVPDGGSIGNASFVAIPYNAASRAGAMVLADFLLSPEAQARKQDPAVWGGFTVLALDRLDDADRAVFDALDLGPATLSPEELGAPLPEPHPEWTERVAADWTRRFGAGR